MLDRRVAVLSQEQRCFAPSDIAAPTRAYLPYGGTLGRMEWELAAEEIILVSKITGYWIPISGRGIQDQDGMVKAGLLEKQANDFMFMLTDEAIQRIHAKYPAHPG